MTDTVWSGPWCHAELAGARVAWDPLAGRGRPSGSPAAATADVFVVRWRVTGFANPRKRSFRGATAIAEAAAFARSIAAAALRSETCDHRGWPASAAPVSVLQSLCMGPTAQASPPNGREAEVQRSVVEGQCEPRDHGNVAGQAGRIGAGDDPKDPTLTTATATPTAAGAADLTTLLALATPDLREQVAGLLARHADGGSLTAAVGDQAGQSLWFQTPPPQRHGLPGAAGPALAGHTVSSAVDALLDEFAPAWRSEGQYDWWETQLRTVKSCFTYPDADPRIVSHGGAAGESIHFQVLQRDDYAAALQMRRTVDNGAAHRNQQRQAKHARLQREYETKLSAWNGRSGHRGRKPVAPPAPELEREVAESPDETVIGARTENAFRMTMSFVFDRAFTAGWMPPGPNSYRLWNPVGQGGRGRSGRSPFRRPDQQVVRDRVYPTGGFFADLGDTLAGLGADVGGGRTTGERYRALPLSCWQLAPRPGEMATAREWHLQRAPDRLIAHFTPEQGDSLKLRGEQTTRPVHLSALVASVVAAHVTAGLGTKDGLLFASPLGYALDTSNFLEDFLRPALDELCDPGNGLWPEFAHLRGTDLKLFRKAGITTWISYGLDTRQAAFYAGHHESVLINTYRGVLDKHSGVRQWRGIDWMVEQALLDARPRGAGRLGVTLNAWLQA